MDISRGTPHPEALLLGGKHDSDLQSKTTLCIWVPSALSYSQESLGELAAQPLEDMEAEEAEWPPLLLPDGGRESLALLACHQAPWRHLGDIQ